MATNAIRKNFLTFQAVRTNLRCFHSVKRVQNKFNSTLLIGASCTCLAAWHTWRKYSKNNVMPKVHAAQESGEVI